MTDRFAGGCVDEDLVDCLNEGMRPGWVGGS